MMRDTITYQAASTHDAYGEITHGTPRTYRARVVGQQKLVAGFSGDEVMSQYTVYVGAPIRVQPTDTITLSTGLTNSTEGSAIRPPILGASRVPDQSGLHHAVIYLG